MPHPFQWDDTLLLNAENYRVKPPLAFGGLAIGLLLAGLCVSGWQAMAFHPANAARFRSLASASVQADLRNLQRLQNSMNASGEGHLPSKSPTLLSQNTFSDDSIKRELHDPIGRPDPFSPLFHEVDDTPKVVAPVIQKRDILQDVSYTGFIGDNRSSGKVAILHIADPSGGETTVIKKSGETFDVEGQRVVLNTINADGIRVNFEGSNRWLTLQSYQASSQPTATTGASASSGGSPGYRMTSPTLPTGPSGFMPGAYSSAIEGRFGSPPDMTH
jgi:hypothetical protein